MIVQNLPKFEENNWVKIPVDLPTFVFALRACKDAVVTLGANPEDMTQQAYEISIGEYILGYCLSC